jgi:hypothetical protein
VFLRLFHETNNTSFSGSTDRTLNANLSSRADRDKNTDVVGGKVRCGHGKDSGVGVLFSPSTFVEGTKSEELSSKYWDLTKTLNMSPASGGVLRMAEGESFKSGKAITHVCQRFSRESLTSD